MSLVTRCAKRFSTGKSNFSIDHILNVAGRKPNFESFSYTTDVVAEEGKFEWLNCTRYRPPKLPRQRKREGIQRRKLGRNPRIPFSSSQVAFLEAKFHRTPYLSSSDVTQLASHLKLSETRVKIWFQNRRAREKRDKESKSKEVENPVKNMQKISPKEPPTEIVKLEPQKNSIANHYGFLRCINYTESENYLQIVTPLDLSERQIVYRPK